MVKYTLGYVMQIRNHGSLYAQCVLLIDKPMLDRGRKERGAREMRPTKGGNVTSQNYEIRPYLPDPYHSAILITTRSSRVKLGHRIPLGKLGCLEDSLPNFISYIEPTRLVRRYVTRG
jgi:hypothetical protein